MATKHICSIEGCGKPVIARGLCTLHYQRMKNGTDMAKRPAAGAGVPYAFIMSVIKTPESVTDCIYWPYARSASGHGNIAIDGANYNASRVVCELAHGNPPEPRYEAAHNCGHGHLACVNPHHLRWATPVENQSDRVLHGTYLEGDAVPTAKLTRDQVASIKRDILAKVTDYRLARKFGVADETIRKIRLGKTWSSVPWPA